MVPSNEDIPIDFDTFHLQLRMFGLGDPFTRFNQIRVNFNSGEDKGTTGLQILYENNYRGEGPATTWKVLSCGAAGSSEGAKGVFPEGVVNNEEPKVEEIITIWREETVKLNLMVNDIAVLDNYAVLDEITDESCDRNDGLWMYTNRMDFAEDYGKKVTSVTISGDQSGETAGDIDDVLIGYRIVTREDNEEDQEEDRNESYENGGSSRGKSLSILVLFFSALVSASGFMCF